MKDLIEQRRNYYPKIFPDAKSVIHQMFAVNGSGYNLDNKGYINGTNGDDEVYIFPDPEPFDSMYPWSATERFQPFRQLMGCRTAGFKEAAQYFIDCVMLTPDSVENAVDWKNNIHVVTDCLINTLTKEDEYPDICDGYNTFLEKLEKYPKTSIDKVIGNKKPPSKNSVTKVWFFDVQWSDCPAFVEDEIRHLWTSHELWNDTCIYKATLDKELFQSYPNVYYWLKHKGVSLDEKVIIHWWW